MAELDFVKTWYDRGNDEYGLQKTDGNPVHRVFAFFSYFVALNWLYSTYYYECVFCREETEKRLASKKRTEDCEMTKLIFFLNEAMMKERNFKPFKQLNKSEKDEFDKNVARQYRDSNGHEYEEVPDYVKNETDDVIRLFYNIYHVRCNLYHGAKRKIKSRNMRLIDGANNVLKHLIEIALDKRITGYNIIEEDGGIEEVIGVDRLVYEE